MHDESTLVVGTPGYMSPEQVRGLECGTQSDLWSLGASIYTLLTGSLPFGGGTAHEQMKRTVTAGHRPARDNLRIDGDALALIDQCLAPDPDDRPASAAHLVRVLDSVLERSSGE